MRRLWCISSGHGGILKDLNGKPYYTTAPSKMFVHTFNGNKIPFYEGVYNRGIKKELLCLMQDAGMMWVDISSGNVDLPLSHRYGYANRLHATYKNTVTCDIHGNAGKGTGLEVWTSVGDTPSDPMGQILCEELIKIFPGHTFRPDKIDGDLDKEKNFAMVYKTIGPAFLSENFFFDQWEDAKFMLTKECHKLVALAHFNAFKRIEKEIVT